MIALLWCFRDGTGATGDCLEDGEHEEGKVTPSEQVEGESDRFITDEALLSRGIHKEGASEKCDMEKWMTTRKPVASKRI